MGGRGYAGVAFDNYYILVLNLIPDCIAAATTLINIKLLLLLLLLLLFILILV